MRHLVRVSPAEATEELASALAENGASVRREGAGTIVVSEPDEDLETELIFFVRAWKVSHPTLEVEIEPL